MNEPQGEGRSSHAAAKRGERFFSTAKPENWEEIPAQRGVPACRQLACLAHAARIDDLLQDIRAYLDSKNIAYSGISAVPVREEDPLYDPHIPSCRVEVSLSEATYSQHFAAGRGAGS